MLIDAHCHFNSLSKEVKDKVISSCGSDYRFIDSSIDVESSHISLGLSEQYDFIYTSLGFHPFCGEKFSSEVIGGYEKLIESSKKIVAIGEIGLDYKARISLEKQENILSDFVSLAKRKDLAVVIHNRIDPLLSAANGTLRIFDILDRLLSTYEKVVFHCFSYSKEFLEKIIKRGGFISFSLNILRNNKAIFSSLKECPLEKLLLETDSPYMKIKNRPSVPLDIVQVYSRSAFVKGIEEEKIKEAVFSNARKVFSIR